MRKEPIQVPRFTQKAGFLATEKSSNIMKRIKSKNTQVELKLRKAIWALGYRYRLHGKGILGKPDLIFHKYRLVVFIDGDFWHGFNWATRKAKMKTNKAYWIPKIERNMQRDQEITSKLVAEKWRVLRFWEHEVLRDSKACIAQIISKIKRIK